MRTTLSFVLPAFAGLLFGFGLILSGMTDPRNVLGFLDVAGAWNPALAFVMGGAVAVTLPMFAWARRRGRALLGAPLALPDRRSITPGLIGGSALFGLGWGLSGVCPGPGFVLAATGSWQALLFVAAMVGGFWLSDALQANQQTESFPIQR
ncbi:YeeE/YedE family protein [Fontimonas sp. SYSU GA230001]|uniref:YeeE/YedE family protein n=1 Tax=Fontimonas sp. SYSU GA230001 TaxID=3142450 RepID=UPI0032B4F47E